MGRVSYWEQESEAVAAFFQGTYDISETVSLTGGLRYTKEDKDAMAWMKNSANTYRSSRLDRHIPHIWTWNANH